jgi:hypothetical protein
MKQCTNLTTNRERELSRYLVEVIRPALERLAHRLDQLRSVVNARYARPRTADAIEYSFDNLRLDA